MSRFWILTILLVVQADSTRVTADERPFPVSFDWGTLATTPAAVELRVKSIPDDRVIKVPRINNPYRRIFLQSDADRSPLAFRPEVSEWLITLPDEATAPETVVIETVGAPLLVNEPVMTEANKEGEFVLPAHLAVVHGKLLRYEPQPHKNTVGYWADEDDWCEWHIAAEQPGQYNVQILQGCGKGHGGSEVQIRLGDSELTFIVEDTGHFQNFRARSIGTLEIRKAGRHSLKVVPVNKAKGAVMDVRQIRLIPVRS